MANLKSTVETLANDFARNLLAALRGMSIDEIVSVTGGGVPGARRGPGRPPRAAGAAAAAASPRARRGKGGRLARRSIDEIASMVETIAALLAKKPEGLRAEQIRAELGVDAKELPRPLADGVKAGRFSKKGQKRATTYFAGGGGSASKRRPSNRK